MFAITDLASIQEEHSIQLPHASADRERRENGVTPPATQAQRVGGLKSHLVEEGWLSPLPQNP